MLTPDAEAPAEMMFYFPQFRVLDAAEVACSLIHNVYTLRGAEMRDAEEVVVLPQRGAGQVGRQERRGDHLAQLADLAY